MKTTVKKIVGVFAISALLLQSTILTAFAEVPEGYEHEYFLEVSPDFVFVDQDIVIDLYLDEGDAMYLPEVEWPSFEGGVEDWAAENPDDVDALNDAIIDELNAGKDYVRFYMRDSDTNEIVYYISILVDGNPFVRIYDDGVRVIIPAADDSLEIPAGDYKVQFDGRDSLGEDYYGEIEFSVYEMINLDFDIDLSFVDLFADDEDEDVEIGELEPGGIQISPEFAEPGEEVLANVSDVSSPDVLMVLPDEGWEIRLQTEADETLATTADGSIEFTAEGYLFAAPGEKGAYDVELYNADSASVVDSELLTVEESEDNLFDGQGLEVIIDLPVFDPVDDEDDVADDQDDSNEADDSGNVVDETDCDDVSLDHWGLEYINPLFEDGMFPVVEDGVGVTCRPDTGVLRKEFTVWLLQTYQPDEFVAVDPENMGESPFNDLDEDDIYTPYIIKAAELEIINGNPDGSFKPDSEINRAEVLKILLRSSELFFETDDEFDALVDEYALDMIQVDPIMRFTDVSDEDWFYRYLYYGVANNIIKGYDDGEAKMGQGVTYAEAAKILYLALELEADLEVNIVLEAQ